MHIFNAKLTDLTLQLHGIIPFRPIKVETIALTEDLPQDNKWLAFFWTHVSNKRLAKLTLRENLKLVHNPNGKEHLHPIHDDWIRFSIYSVTQKDAFAVYNAHRNIFLHLEFDHITVKGTRMETNPNPAQKYSTVKRRKASDIVWPEDENIEIEDDVLLEI
jgi:hypothetical protein